MPQKRRVLLLTHPSLIPPVDKEPTKDELEKVPWRTEWYVKDALLRLGHIVEVFGLDSDLKELKKMQETFKPHIVFNLLEQFDGEALLDYSVVSFMEMIHLAYTGCNPKGLMLARDKSLSKKILFYHRVKTPFFEVAPRGKKFTRPKRMDFPLIVKSLTDEGSAGISQSSVVQSEDKLQERIDFIHESIGSDAIVESYIEGRDIYVALMGNKKIEVFPPLELHFGNPSKGTHQIATSKVKWSPEYREKQGIELRPAQNISAQDILRVQNMSKKIYKILGLSGLARLDLRLKENGEIYFIEANPNPDIANGDEFAIAAALNSCDYLSLIQKVLSLGLSWEPAQAYHSS